jgi:hypothetical protein
VSGLTSFRYSSCVTAGAADVDCQNNSWNNFRKCVKQGDIWDNGEQGGGGISSC